MSYVESFDDGPREARRPFDSAVEECDHQLQKLTALVSEVDGRTRKLRLSVPRPETDEKAMKAARDIHSPAVDQLMNLRDNIQGLQRRLAVLLEELEV